MKNWIKNHYSYFERNKIAITHWLGEKLIKYKEIKKGPLGTLQHHALRREKDKPFGPFKPPEDIQIDLYSIIYIDLIFLEDYDKLSVGFTKLYENYRNLPLGKHDLDRIQKWIEESKYIKYGHGWSNVGYFDFNSQKSRSSLEEFESIQINLHQFVPSFITVIYICRPSKKLRKDFSELILQSTKQELNIHRISWKYGFSSISMKPPELVKEIQIDEFMLKTQKRFIQFLRSNINCGFSKYGPIKSIEVLSINQSLDIFPKKYDHNMQRNREVESFLEILGKVFYHNDYHTYYYRFYRIERSKHYSLGNYQILISEKDYINNNKSHSEDHNNWMYYELSDEMIFISVFLSLEFLYDKLLKKVIDVRNMISATILGKGIKSLFTRSLTRLANKYTDTNETNFRYQRIYNEINYEHLDKYYSDEIENIKRMDYKTDNEITFSKDFREILQDKQKYIETNLNYLRSFFNEFLTFRYTKSNIRLQRVIVFLTIVLTVLTITMVDQSPFIKEVIKYIKYIFSLVT